MNKSPSLTGKFKYVAFRNFMGVDPDGKPSFSDMEGYNTHVMEHLRDFARQAREKPHLRPVSFQTGVTLSDISMLEAFRAGREVFMETWIKRGYCNLNFFLEKEYGVRIVPEADELEYRARPSPKTLWG